MRVGLSCVKCSSCEIERKQQTILAAETAAWNSASVELNAVCVCVLDQWTIAAPARTIAHPVVNFHFGLTLAEAALTKHAIVGSSGKVGTAGRSAGNGIGGSLKLPSGRFGDNGPVVRLTSYCNPHFLVWQRQVTMPLRCLLQIGQHGFCNLGNQFQCNVWFE